MATSRRDKGVSPGATPATGQGDGLMIVDVTLRLSGTVAAVQADYATLLTAKDGVTAAACPTIQHANWKRA